MFLLIAVVWLLCGALAAPWDLNRTSKVSALDVGIAACLVLTGPFALLIHRVIYGR